MPRSIWYRWTKLHQDDSFSEVTETLYARAYVSFLYSTDDGASLAGPLWWLWLPSRNGGDPSVAGGPPTQAAPKVSPAGSPGGHTTDPLRPGEIGSEMGLGFSRMVFLASLHRPYFL